MWLRLTVLLCRVGQASWRRLRGSAWSNWCLRQQRRPAAASGKVTRPPGRHWGSLGLLGPVRWPHDSVSCPVLSRRQEGAHIDNLDGEQTSALSRGRQTTLLARRSARSAPCCSAARVGSCRGLHLDPSYRPGNSTMSCHWDK